ncbi:MAG: dihydrolipoamide acetyltransferase family protein [Acidithiobacillales bacterium]
MPTNVIMPQMGESIAEGTLTKWLKKPGEPVKRDEPLFEISTDKVDAEIPAPASGVLLEVLVEEGKTVPINTVVAVLGEETERPHAGEPPSVADSSKAAEAASSAATPAPPPAPAPAPAGAARPSSAPPRPDETAEELLRRRSSPVVRSIAEKHGIDISAIPGTGISGRVTKADILEVVAKGGQGPAPAPAPAAAAAAPAPSSVPSAAPEPPPPPSGLAVSAPAPGPPPPAGAAPIVTFTGSAVVVEPMSAMRRKIAERMVASKQTSAHVTSVFEIDLTNVARLRDRVKDRFQAQYGTKLTYMPFVFRAAITALKARPLLNASISGDEIVYHKDINLGMAVALDWGLIVPVIRHADDLSLVGLARAANDLAERARTKKLTPDEVAAGTFTITNHGGFGSLFATPVINQPQVGILGVGVIEKRPKVVTMPDGSDTIAVRTMAYMGVTFDHRLVDGAEGDTFMSIVKNTLENERWSELESL